MMNVPLHTGDEFGILLRQKKYATISARETNWTKKSMSTTAPTYWQSSAEIWEGQRNNSLNNEVDKTCFSIRKDWRFAVRAKSFALHWRSRGFFRVTCAVVRKVYERNAFSATRQLWTPFKYGRLPWQHIQSQLLVGKRKPYYHPQLEIGLKPL